jgi:hypothetical protein
MITFLNLGCQMCKKTGTFKAFEYLPSLELASS